MELTNLINIVYVIVVGLSGTFGNSIIVVVFWKKKRKLSTDILVMALAMTDLASSFWNLVPWIWVRDNDSRNPAYCTQLWLIGRSTTFTTAIVTFLIGTDRYLAICRPLKWNSSKNRAIVAAVIAASFSIASSIHVGYYASVGDGPQGKFCYVNSPNWIRTFDGILINALFSLIGICVWYYGRIWQVMKRQRRVMAEKRHEGISRAPTSHVQMDKSVISTVSSQIPSDVRALPRPDQSPSDITDESPAAKAKMALSGPGEASDCEPPTASQKEQYGIQNGQPDHEAGNGVKAACAFDGPNADHSVKDQQKHPQQAGPEPGRQKRDMMTRMLLVATVIYILTSLPTIVFENLPPDVLREFLVTPAGIGSVLFGYGVRKVNYTVNIFVYLALNKRFRRDCLALFKRRTSE